MKIRVSQVNTMRVPIILTPCIYRYVCVVRSRFALNPVNHGQEKQAQGEKKRPCDGLEGGSFAGPPRLGASSRASV